MSFSSLESALLDYVADVIVNDCEQPNPKHIFRYHGRRLPQVSMIVPKEGLLSIGWDQEYATEQFPVTAAARPDAIVTQPVSVLVVRYVVCWPSPKQKADGNLILSDALINSWDALSATLADIADTVQRALMSLNCTDGLPPGDEDLARLIDVGCHKFRFKETNPIDPQGAEAGIEWRSFAAVRNPGNVS